jgi:hypothetical protein
MGIFRFQKIIPGKPLSTFTVSSSQAIGFIVDWLLTNSATGDGRRIAGS